MILSKTPLRLSLFGGGTDLPEYFTRAPGAVVSFTIDRYIYVGVNEKFDGLTRVSYSKTEIVDDPWKLEHDLVRETLKHFHVKGVEITSVSDIPGEGSGLGSSSAFTVGLVLALTKYMKGSTNQHPGNFAQLAYAIERHSCGHPVGKQDHYAAAFGGVRYYQFNQDGTVNAESIRLNSRLRFFLEGNVMLFWTGKTRSARGILQRQADRLKGPEAFQHGLFLANQAVTARMMIEDGNFGDLGEMLHEGWERKKRIAPASTPEIDALYHRARLAGARGGKIAGAGGGGFLMLIADLACQREIEKVLGLPRVLFAVEERGSQIVYPPEKGGY